MNVESRQHSPPFAESREGNWTAEKPGHRHGKEEGEEMVADDVQKGSIPIRLVNQAKSEERNTLKI